MKNLHGSVICLALAIGVFSSRYSSPLQNSQIPSEQLTQIVRQNPDHPVTPAWQRLKKINQDLKAVLFFESGLLCLPVVQTDNNSTYLTKAFDGSYNICGTPFLDYQDHLDDQAFLIYGHRVHFDKRKMFSPLHELESQEGYEKNHTFYLITGSEQRKYEILSVFRIEVYPSVFDQRRSVFRDEKDFNQWIRYARKRNEIIPSESAEYGDQFCLLQTCVAGNENERLIVLAHRKYR